MMNTNNPILQDQTSWQAGYAAAAAGLPQYPMPPGVQDHLAFCSGWIEGDADLRLAKRIARLPAEQRRFVDSLLWS